MGLLAAFFVVVSGGEGGLAEGCDGEILFSGVGGEGYVDVLVRLFERCHGALDGFGGVAGDACAGYLACDWRDG